MRRLAGERAYSEALSWTMVRKIASFLELHWRNTVKYYTHSSKAGRRICIGNMEYQNFAGYFRRANTTMSSVSNRAVIQANHRMMVQEDVCAGNILNQF